MQPIRSEMCIAEELLIQVKKFPGSTDRELIEMLRGKGAHSLDGIRVLYSGKRPKHTAPEVQQ